VVRWLTVAYRAKGGNSSALEAIKRLYSSHRTIDETRKALGDQLADIYEKMLNWDETIQQYLQLASDYPLEATKYKWYAASVYKVSKRDPANAETLVRQVLQAEPDMENARDLLAECLYQQTRQLKRQLILLNCIIRYLRRTRCWLSKQGVCMLTCTTTPARSQPATSLSRLTRRAHLRLRRWAEGAHNVVRVAQARGGAAGLTGCRRSSPQERIAR